MELLQNTKQLGGKRMTNAEHIQMLSKWDLAEFIYNVSNGATKISNCNEECAKCDYSDSYCTFQIAEWLNQKIGADE